MSSAPTATSCKGRAHGHAEGLEQPQERGGMFLPPCTHLPLGTNLIQLLPLGAHIPRNCQRSKDCRMHKVYNKERDDNKAMKKQVEQESDREVIFYFHMGPSR